MSNNPPQHDPRSTAENTTGRAVDQGTPPATPRWVKIFGMIALVVIVLIIVMLLIGGEHGPGRHSRAFPTGGTTALISDGGGHV